MLRLFLVRYDMMKSRRSILALSLIAAIGVPAVGMAGGPSGRNAGGFTGAVPYQHPQHSTPHSYGHTTPPRQPVFGPNKSLGVPHAVTPRSNMPSGIVSPKGIRSHQSAPAYNFHGKDLHHLDADHLKTWRHGRWHHGKYRGVYGWWWFTGGYWYWYQEPIFPYPDYVSSDVEPEMDEEAPPDAEPPGNAQDDFYYHCSDPDGYYPYVSTCNQPWETVPAAPSP